MAKYARVACPAMLHHYQRDLRGTLERDNIDEGRTPGNYVLGPGSGMDGIDERVREVEETMTRSVRSDAVLMCDWVVTVPPDVREEDHRAFFEAAYRFVEDRYGSENMLGGWVHVDEATPHMHCAFTPVVERDGGRLAFSAKDLVSRSDLKTFHDDLSREMERSLGYRCQIRLDDSDRLGKALSRIDGLDDYKRVKDEIARSQDRLERLRRDERGAGERNRELGGRAEELREALRREEARERQIEEALRERSQKAEEVQRAVEGARERVGVLEGLRDALRDRIGELGERIESVRVRLAAARGLIADRLGLGAAAREACNAFRMSDRLHDLADERAGRGLDWEPTFDRGVAEESRAVDLYRDLSPDDRRDVDDALEREGCDSWRCMMDEGLLDRDCGQDRDYGQDRDWGLR